MKKNTKLITAISTAAIVLSLIAPAAVSVSAAQSIPTTPPTGVSASKSDDWSNADNWSPDQIANFFKNSGDKQVAPIQVSQNAVSNIDAYVSVVNNQYVLINPEKSGLSTQDINSVKSALDLDNKTISANGLTIDASTKQILYPQVRSDFPSAQWFWWGFRYSFTSNSQVTAFRNTLVSLGDEGITASYFFYAAGIGTALVAPSGGGVIAAIGGSIGTYARLFADASRATYNYNRSHQHSYIHVDINIWRRTYSLGTGLS